MVFVEVLLVVAPGPSEEAFPAAAAGAGASPVGALRVAAAAEEAFLAEVLPSAAAAAAGAFLAEALPSAAEEAAAALRPCPGVGRTSLVLLRGRAPSLMLGASRARLVPSRAPAGYSGGGGARAAARALRWRLCAAASRRVASQGRPDHLSSRGAAGASASQRGKLTSRRRLQALFAARYGSDGRQSWLRVRIAAEAKLVS